mmetsp:Transcript_6515/g.14077  ORF Transcript_6515/g.14077 Transcript_6515/m.14077 type:complete len:418 (-) Transcript_6515:192-1445(-)
MGNILRTLTKKEPKMSAKKEGAELLTVDTIPAWIAARASAVPVLKDIDASALTAEIITGGNMNFAFRVTSSDPAVPTIFLKQAPEYVAIFGPDGLPITSERMQKEMDVYDEWRVILGEKAGEYLPNIYVFDTEQMVTVMEFLEGHALLDAELVSSPGSLHASVGSSLGDFLGKIHVATHSSSQASDRLAHLTSYYENRPMRDIQLEFVFTKCYVECTEEERAGLVMDDAFLAEVAALRSAYDGKVPAEEGCGYVLSHGDLHPGSVMVSRGGSTKVIDPEFCVYGPPGLDVGSALSGYVLAAVHHAHSGEEGAGAAVIAIRDGIQKMWETYAAALAQDPALKELIHKIGAEAVGFTVAEVCRTALGKAGGRLWLQFEDKEVKAKAIKTSMGIVQRCMVGRHEGGIDLLLKELEDLVVQ